MTLTRTRMALKTIRKNCHYLSSVISLFFYRTEATAMARFLRLQY